MSQGNPKWDLDVTRQSQTVPWCHKAIPNGTLVSQDNPKCTLMSLEKMYVAKKDDKPQDVMKLMLKKRIRHVPVMDNGVIVGLISIGDLLNYLLEKYEEEAFLLREHIKNPMGIHVYGDNK